ncbi:sensor histidine kinase [Blastococcus litoris]|uniref:sensor histidine kinase n=1 Tax=Blastococcus litoris TaxID=2171622 RepID=UPI000E30499C|nr:histidine kinase [Blastococcus litoris]
MAPSQPRPVLPPRSDVVLAAVLCALSLVQVAVAPIASPVVSALVAVGSTAPLAWRRVLPSTAALVMTAVWTIPTADGFLLLGYVIAGLLFYSVGAYATGTWRILGVCTVGLVAGVALTLLGPEHPTAAIGAALVVVGPAAAGRLVAHQREQNRRLRELTGQLLRERALAERTAVAEERARIARELHDVLGHEVTVIALQADAAAAALTKAPDRAAAPIAAIRRSAAEALTEMRRAVGLLRDDGDGALRPQPGLADVPALVEQHRAAGGPVELTFRPPSRPLHASVGLAGYRLVQEALTNASRHAPGSPVRVCVDGDGPAVVVEVVNDAGTAAGSPGSGFGLVGMRERVRLLGGELDAGPRSDGGFGLRARLPVDVPAAR